MNFLRPTWLLFSGIRSSPSRVLLKPSPVSSASNLRQASGWILSRAATECAAFPWGIVGQAEGAGVLQQLPWQHQQIRTRKRGTEYQPNNIKRKRTHGWIKRISTRGGIEVILRRMLKGRKSLTH